MIPIASGSISSRRAAAAAAGIDPSTLHRWLQRGTDITDPDTGRIVRKAPSKYRAFRDAVVHARADAEATNTVQVVVAGRTDWRASGFFLERSFPQRWGRRDGLAVQQFGDGTPLHRATHQFSRAIMDDPDAAIAAHTILAKLAGVDLKATNQDATPETERPVTTVLTLRESNGDRENDDGDG